MREAADRLLAATEARRVELGKKWKQVYQEAGLTHQTLNRWRNGHGVDPLTERALERALQWAPGAREAIATGGQPQPLKGPTPEDGPERRPLLSQEEEILRGVITVTAEQLGLSPDEAEEAFKRAKEDLGRRPAPSPEPSQEESRRRRAM